MEKKKRKKYGGRKKGTPNKDTRELRERLSDLIDMNFNKLQTDLDNLDPKERVNTVIKLLDFALPKLRSIENKVDFMQLSDEQIDQIIKEIEL